MRRTLITGGSGFIGRGVLPRAREVCGEIHVTTAGHGGRPLDPDVVWHHVDLLDQDAVERVVQDVRPTHLLHLAWHVVPGRYDDPANVRWVRASLGLLDAFGAAGGQRAVLVGSCYEYDVEQGLCTEGRTPLHPKTAYGRAKAALGDLVGAWAEGTGVSCAWARVFNAYGPAEDPRRLVAAVIVGLLAGEVVPTTAGTQIRDLLHTADIGAALVAVLDSDLEGPINIGSGEPIALKQVMAAVAEQIGRPDLLAVGALPMRQGDPPLIVADTRLLHEATGWRPRFDLSAGLADTISWWRAQLAHGGHHPADHLTGARR